MEDIKLDADGNLVWEENYGGSGFDIIGKIQQTTDEGFIMAMISGSTDNDFAENNGETDYWIIKLNSAPVGITNTQVDPQIRISPNPSNGNFRIAIEGLDGLFQVQIFDSLGRSIYHNNKFTSQAEIKNIPQGIYSVSISLGGLVTTRMLIVQ